MKRVDQLITEARGWTNNASYSTTEGIPQERFVEALRDAQMMLQGAVLRANPDCTWFDKQISYNVTTSTRTYALPSDCWYADAVKLVEFSETGQTDYYIPIDKINYDEHTSYSSWPPYGYDIRAGQIWLTPPPNLTVGTLRVTYVARMPTLDLPRGTITSLVTVSLTLNNDAFLDATSLGAHVPGYISVTRRLDGAAISYSCTVTGYNSGTRVLTVSAGPTYETGFTVTDLANNMVTLQEFSTCSTGVWPKALQALVERYLVAYTKWAIFMKDSSEDQKPGGNQLTAIENDIIHAAQSTWGQIPEIPMDSGL